MPKKQLTQLDRDIIIAQRLRDIANLQDALKEKLVSVGSVAEANRKQLQTILNLPKGDKGDKGERGEMGPRGIAGRNGKDGVNGKDGYIPVKGKDYFTEAEKEILYATTIARIKAPKDGKDAVIDKKQLLQDLVTLLKEEEIFDIKNVKGLRAEIDSYRHQLAGKHYGKNTWARGGGDTVTAGANITITENANGQKVIASTGGGVNLATGEVTAVQSGNDVTIDLTQLPNLPTSVEWVSLNGQIIRQSRWSIVGTTLTVTDAFDTDEFQLQYQYA